MAEQLTYTQIIKAISRNTGISEKQVRKVYNALEDLIFDEVAFHEGFRFRKIGILYAKYTEGYYTTMMGQQVYIAPRLTPKFKFAPSFKELLKNPTLVSGKLRRTSGETIKAALKKEMRSQQMLDLMNKRAHVKKKTRQAKFAESEKEE